MSSKRQESNFVSRTRKKRRKGAEAKSPAGLKSYVHEVAEDSRENEIRGARGQSSQKRNNPLSKSRPRNREARKSRAQRRRRRKKDRGRKERKRSGKDSRQDDKWQDVALRASKYKRKTHDGLGGFPTGRLDSARTNESEYSIEKSSYLTVDGSSAASTMSIVVGTTMSSGLQHQPTLGTTRKPVRTTPRRGIYADTVEREFSRHLEMEISKSALKDSSFLEDDIFDRSPKKSAGQSTDKSVASSSSSADNKVGFGSSRYDAEKMLGYTRTEEDLPILDLENEVLARTLKDYNAYMTSSLKLVSLPRHDETSIRRATGSHPPRKPIINSEESDEDLGGSTEVTGVTKATRDDNTRGDLSCINGTFLPAPLSRHALIKYVK